MLCERKKKHVKEDSECFNLTNWKDGITIQPDEEGCGWSRNVCEGNDQQFSFGEVEFEISIRHLNGEVE